MAIYAVGDIHGCYDEWMALNNRILGEDPDARFVLLGDIIDRGPKSLAMIRWMMENVDNKREDSRYKMVIGNHEFEKIAWWREKRYRWKQGYYHSDRYGFDKVLEDGCLSVEEIDEIVEAFANLPYEIQATAGGKKFVISHADVISWGRGENLEPLKQCDLMYEDKQFIVWNRDYREVKGVFDNIQIVNGHTPTVLLPGDGVAATPGVCYHAGNRHIVDCGMVYEAHFPDANLCALRLDDMGEIYLYEERAMQARKRMDDMTRAFMGEDESELVL